MDGLQEIAMGVAVRCSVSSHYIAFNAVNPIDFCRNCPRYVDGIEGIEG